ncbi:hypothetical protein C1645_745993 [Glomus cerebriforme]|uniref:HMG box domain-containing protein n=1 Tax=Glomus cerebriforme TaxID=658196 RepID=A0A397S3C0_9GLOM|nr:hypothetical protein C1645_745993 [Glomus cerebriforme]
MASQTQEIVRVANITNDTTENTSAMESHWQELIAATEITADNAQDTKVNKMNGNTSTESSNTTERQKSSPIGINFIQQAQDDGQASVIIFESSISSKPKIAITACREKKYNDEDTVNKKDSGKITSEKKRRQAPIKQSIIPEIQALGSTNETSATSRTSKKRKTEPYISAVTFRAKEKSEVSKRASVTIGEKRYKLVADTIAFSQDFASEMPPPQSDEQENNNEAEVAEYSFNGDITTKRRRQIADKPKIASIERPRRSIRPVIPYGSEAAEQKVRNKKPVEISQGSGLPLSQIPHVLRAIDKMKTGDDVLKGLHKLIYGRMGSKHDIKNHIRSFSGFKIQTPLDEIVLKEKLEKWKIAGLKEMCHLFGLKSSGDKQKVVDRVYDFLKNPRDMTAPNEENGKGKSGKKKKSAAVKAKTPITRRKTARDIFKSEQRIVYKEKAENHSKTRAEVDSLLAEAWKGLTEDDKKSYVEKAAEANKNEPQQKRQNKAKQPEIVEDSDLSEEEFEDPVMHEGEVEKQKDEQPKDTDIVDSNSDFSDPPGDNEDADTEEDNAMEVDLDKSVS